MKGAVAYQSPKCEIKHVQHTGILHLNSYREPCGSVLCITGFVILNSDKAVMTTLGHTLSCLCRQTTSQQTRHIEPMLAQCWAIIC